MARSSLDSALYTGRFDDGLLDLFVGLGLLAAGGAWLSGHMALIGLAPAVLIPLWIAVRRQVTEPRLGRVEFSPDRRRSEQARLSSAFGAGIGALVLAVGAAAWLILGGREPAAFRSLAPLLPALLLAMGLVIVSAIIGARRFVIYALLLAAIAALTTWLGGEPWLYLLVGGGMLSLWAASVFVRFLSAHPDLERE